MRNTNGAEILIVRQIGEVKESHHIQRLGAQQPKCHSQEHLRELSRDRNEDASLYMQLEAKYQEA